MNYENKTPGKAASFLGKMMKTPVAYDFDRKLKTQAIIDVCGLPKVLFAAVIGGMGKIVKRNGLFYVVLGREASGIDGLYTGSDIPFYREHAILIPKNYQAIIDEIEEKTLCPAFVSDTNDISCNIYGLSKGVSLSKAKLETIMDDNPGGQNDELTPFIIIRRVSEDEKEDCVLPPAIK